MSSWLDAIKTYFEIRNRSWVNLDTREFLQQVCASKDIKWYKYVRHLIERKQRALQQQGKRLLRVHSTMRVFDAVEHEVKEYESSAHESGQIHVQVEETIYWVYQDKDKFAVESRVINHRQVWAAKRGNWFLAADEETNEKDKSTKGADSHVAGYMGGHVAGHVAGHEGAHAGAQTHHVIVPSVPSSSFAFGKVQQMPELDSARVVSQNQYDRVKAIRYAELWWNGYNPVYPLLEDDCTNFISQCLHAGRLGMSKPTNRTSGWWYQFDADSAGLGAAQGASGKRGSEPWSYSWAVSQMLYQHLTQTAGATQVASARELKMGDVVFYDWDGSGRYHHTTIVTDFDEYGDPLVNAHTDPSLHRPYTYFDSRAWTRKTRYAFIHIPDKPGLAKQGERPDGVAGAGDLRQYLRA